MKDHIIFWSGILCLALFQIIMALKFERDMKKLIRDFLDDLRKRLQ